MPMASALLKPGVNTQLTQALNEAGVSESNLIRYQDQLIQKVGGWDLYYSVSMTSTIRDIHAWQDVSGVGHLAVGCTGSLNAITNGSNADITPQTRTDDFAPNFSVSSGSNVVTIISSDSNLTLYDSVYFNTPVAVGTLLVNGGYRVNTVGGSTTYTIIVTGISCTTIVSSGILPIFTSSANSAIVTVVLPNHGFSAIPGVYQQFIAPTSLAGQTIQGKYQISSVIDTTSFTINLTQQSSANATATMNASGAQAVYYLGFGPAGAGGGGYGVGPYGMGGYGVGAGSGVAPSTGTPITSSDWTLDNWGGALLACQKDGPIFVWSADSGFQVANVIGTAPYFNGGIFVSQPQQILVSWRSVQSTGEQNPLVVRWSNTADYSDWAVNSGSAAGSVTLPTGSKIVGGLQAPTQGVIWTDVDVWVMQYVGGIVTFNFTRVGSGCGLIAPHAAGILSGQVFWCGTNNFFRLGGSGAEPIKCTVWDFIFQNMNRDYASRVMCAPNSMFNEITWYFPSLDSTGENDAYVKLNILENAWDYGYLPRNAWSDVTALGNPIGTDTVSIYQHENGYDSNGTPIGASFESGYWSISDGNDFVFVDMVIPDMKYTTFNGAGTAQCEITFRTVDYLGDTPRVYGPYIYTNTTEYINTRLRGRLMSIQVASNDIGSFWRMGRVRYRYSPAGRR